MAGRLDSPPPPTPDIGCEVEVRVSEVSFKKKRKRGESTKSSRGCPSKRRRVSATATPSESKTRQRKALNKTEKAEIILSIRETDVNGAIIPRVGEVVTAQSHVQSCPDQVLFWEAFKDSGELIMGAIVTHLRDAFATMYEKYSTGNDKYLQFQMEWHKYCSAFLLSNTDLHVSSVGIDSSVHVDLAKIQERWIGYCQGKSAELCMCPQCSDDLCLLSSV